MRTKILTILGIILFFQFSVNAQIAIAVAKDENGSSLKWEIAWNKGYNTEYTARKALMDDGYKTVYSLSGGEKRGHNLTSGYWVVVEATRKSYDGKMITSFGLGASSVSYEEAEERAVSNLSQYDWSWTEKNGYDVSKSGTF